MKIFNYLIILICIISPVKADLNQNIISELKKGGKIIFIRHAYAPGGGDPNNFDINDCDTQRNLNDKGRLQSKKIGDFFKKNKISIKMSIQVNGADVKKLLLSLLEILKQRIFLTLFLVNDLQKTEKIK